MCTHTHTHNTHNTHNTHTTHTTHTHTHTTHTTHTHTMTKSTKHDYRLYILLQSPTNQSLGTSFFINAFHISSKIIVFQLSTNKYLIVSTNRDLGCL